MSSQITVKERAAQLLERAETNMDEAYDHIINAKDEDMPDELLADLRTAAQAVSHAAAAIADALSGCYVR